MLRPGALSSREGHSRTRWRLGPRSRHFFFAGREGVRLLYTHMLSKMTGALCALLLASTASAQPWTSSRPDGHAPIGVMADHTHGAGEFMLSYRFMYMDMAGSRIGTDAIEETDIVSPMGEGFLVSPTEMPMQMHMLGAMYAPTDRVTLMVMLPYLQSEMDHVSRMSVMDDPEAVAFTTEASGLGDVKLAALIGLAEFGRSRAHATLGVSLPTGSIEEMDETPMSAPNETLLPYPMQIGSGTYDLQPSLTYLGQSDRFGWGAQARGTIRLGQNTHAYTLGNRLAGTAWTSVLVTDALSLSARADVQTWGNIRGGDPAYAMAVAGRVVPTVFTDLRSGTRADVSVGVNLQVPALPGMRIAAEVAAPVYQSLTGPQLETDLVATVGAQYAF